MDIKKFVSAFIRIDPPDRSFNALIMSLQKAITKEVDFMRFLKSVDKAKDQLLQLIGAYVDHEKYSFVECKLAVLKILNLMISKYQFLRRNSIILAKPFGLLIDPSNGCNLHCPGCVHSPTTPVKFLWPAGLMKEELFRAFLDSYGPYAFKIGFFNYGEPLLNKLTPRFIRLSKNYLLDTLISTNLSMGIDADELVLSGLDCMIVSMDGATSETYSKYRRGGRIEVVMENLHKIIEAKRRHRSLKPYIIWQFLLFEHNRHEIELARNMALQLGVDELHLLRPFSVTWDDPDIRIDDTNKSESIFFNSALQARGENQDRKNMNRIDFQVEATVNALFELEWRDQYRLMMAQHCTQSTSRHRAATMEKSTCSWLYKGIVMDAHGRIMPCCGAPRDDVNLVYSQFVDGGPDASAAAYNTDLFQLSRQSFSNRDLFNKITVNLDDKEIPYCSKCEWEKNSFFMYPVELFKSFRARDLFSIVDEKSMDHLVNW